MDRTETKGSQSLLTSSPTKQKSMALKFKCKSKEEVPAELQSLYVERDGAFVLDVDGAVDKARVDEFRANNITLANQLAEQKKRFDGIGPEEARQLAEEKQITPLTLDEWVDQHVAEARGLKTQRLGKFRKSARS